VPVSTTTTPTKQQERSSPAAWIIGLGIAMTLLGITPIVNGIRYLAPLSGSHFPSATFAVLVALVLIDGGLRKFAARWALSPARQLQRCVEEMSGVKLPIVGDDNALIETEIIVSFNRHVDQLGLNLEKDCFGP